MEYAWFLLRYTKFEINAMRDTALGTRRERTPRGQRGAVRQVDVGFLMAVSTA